MKRFLLLGYGYTARAIESLLLQQYPQSNIFKTSRQGSPQLRFNLNDPATWEKLPSVDGTFWTFPAEDVASVDSLLNTFGDRFGKIVVIGTTGAFATNHDHQEVNEDTPLHAEMERVKGENRIREAKGVAVYAAGIYGPNRNPVDWVRKGWVASSPKYLNVIHVNDLAQICLAAMENGRPGGLYIAADSRPHRWSELIERWTVQYQIKPFVDVAGSRRQSKQIFALRTLAELAVQLDYPDIFMGVSELESQT